MTNLEQSFADLCAKHDVTCLGVNYHQKHNLCWTVYAHGTGALGSFSARTLSEALGTAIAELNARRAPIELADEALPEPVDV